jgi:N-acylneuraminate cytidylyltransferase/CMP-N,N'-diacetyllegionaminic acid synthase
MIEGRRVLALVPARQGSKGLPLKNIRQLHGKPLLAWPIEAARASRYVDRVVISTDSAEFAELAQIAGADAPFLRPAELANDTAPSIDFILHALDTLATAGDHYDYLILLEPTSPLTETADIDRALEDLLAQRAKAEAIVGVSALVSTHPAFSVRVGSDGLMHPYAVNSFGQMPRRQDTEALFSLDGSLYASTVEALRRERGFCHERTLPYITPRYKSFEIDDLIDFICIEAILTHRDLIQNSEQN